MTKERQPNRDPQVSETPGRDGPAYSAKPASDAAPPATGASPPTLSPESLNWYEKRALGLLRGLGADPDDASSHEEGRWPSTWQSFLWDLAPDKVAPPRDGVVLPQWKKPQWLNDLPDDQVEPARKVVRAELDRSLESVNGLELKATRLLTPFVALLTGAVALTIFQMAAIEVSLLGILPIAGAILGSAGVGFLLMGMLRALDADTRLGTSVRATLEQELAEDSRFALHSDHRGIEAAKFVLRKKGNRILFARAAISRGLVMLLLSAVAGAVGLALASDSSDAQQPSQDLGPSTPTSTPSPTSRRTGNPDPTANSAKPTTSATGDAATTKRPGAGAPPPRPSSTSPEP